MQSLSRYFYHDIRFYLIQFLDIVESFEYQTTFITGFYFFHIIFESFQRCQWAFEDLFSFSGDSYRTDSRSFAPFLEQLSMETRAIGYFPAL